MKLPQLSLRELFLLMALAAMGCGWWVDHRGLAETIDQLTPKFQVVEGNGVPLPPYRESGPAPNPTSREP
jgi:hypothetical protein